MYVAITRARQRLYLSNEQTSMLHGQTRYHLPSRFIDELPQDALKWLTAKALANSGGAWGGFAGSRDAYPARQWSTSGGFNTQNASFSAPLPPQLAAAQAAKASHGLHLGAQVFNSKFGEGAVLTLEGSGDNAKAKSSLPIMAASGWRCRSPN